WRKPGSVGTPSRTPRALAGGVSVNDGKKQRGMGQSKLIAISNRLGPMDAPAVHIGTQGTPFILENPAPCLKTKLGMMPRNRRVGKDNIVAGRAPNGRDGMFVQIKIRARQRFLHQRQAGVDERQPGFLRR